MSSAVMTGSESEQTPPISFASSNSPLAQSFRSFYRELTRIHGKPRAKTDADLDYLFEDDPYMTALLNGASPSAAIDATTNEIISTGPSWGTRICYGTGTTYLTFLGLGGAWGFISAFTPSTARPFLQNTQAASASAPATPAFVSKFGSAIPWRLRWNAILNNMTSRGPFVGNSAASVALLYNLCHGAVIRFWRTGEYDVGTATGSAALAGAIFRSTKGVASMARASAGMAGAVLAWHSLSAAFAVTRSQ